MAPLFRDTAPSPVVPFPFAEGKCKLTLLCEVSIATVIADLLGDTSTLGVPGLCPAAPAPRTSDAMRRDLCATSAESGLSLGDT
jgi:hypothetical protein